MTGERIDWKPSRALRIVLADDDSEYLDSLGALLEYAGHKVVARAGDASGLLAAVTEPLPDLAVIDIRMPPTHRLEGLQAAVEIRRTRPGVGILLLSKHVELTHLRPLLDAGPGPGSPEAGGIGYQLKWRVIGPDFVTDVVHSVAAGGYRIDPEIREAVHSTARGRGPLAGLTEQHLNVLHLMAQGLSNSAIAAKQLVSKRTVEDHISTIFGRLGLPPEESETYDRRVRAVLMYLEDAD
ncbi:response regulator [Streptomyces sp. NPDC058739]|uniref:response regulator transcription factor n=1 Tax=Streptomyces sp. NPDC058739 TaxID=3346618 RepID=UPI0036B346BE